MMVGTPAALEREMVGFEFKGPGVFEKDENSTLIVIPLGDDITEENIWFERLEEKDRRYQAFVYNVPFNQTIFGPIKTLLDEMDE